jgi:lantibiotic modifying enzyme
VLFRAEAHEPLGDAVWDAEAVRSAIRGIVADADTAFDPHDLWPAEEWDSWQTPLPLTNLYTGAAGVVWGLDALRRRRHAESRTDLAAAARLVLERWREVPGLFAGEELPSAAEAALLTGESGVLVVAWRVAGGDDVADALLARVRENVGNEAMELMWGSPGTLLAARAMHEWTGDARWADAWRESAERLWQDRDEDGLWTQRLYGREVRSLGVPHGLVGNAHALLQGGEALAPDRRAAIERDTAAALARNAVVEDGLANWPGRDGAPLEAGDGEIRLQWCSGAPGVVIGAASYLDEELLLAGGELIWKAGPAAMAKGSGICHGTAGNGYALLRLFERTGDERWLARARSFAVHALEQVERAKAARGRGRYSLWTGDVGVALFAADCLDARARYPVVDSL